MRTGIATVPLDYGKCPYWLFERMRKLARGITMAIVEEFGPEEFLKRISDPVWFQSLGCVLGFDWNSSGLTTTTLGALKSGIWGMENELGIFICGGKGKTSKKTPEQIQDWGEFLGLSLSQIDSLIYASKMSAKVDSSALQDGFQIYHHNLIFSKSGRWTVVQQGMNTVFQKARRYHWLSDNIINPPAISGYNFIEEPHSGIISQIKVKPLNLTAKESDENRKISTLLVKEEPKTFLNNLALIERKNKGQMTFMELNNIEFYHHHVLRETFNLKRLEKVVFLAHEQNPQNFEQLLFLKGIGPRTIRALSLVSELIYGAKPSYEDPARYSFAHGGKDHVPYSVDLPIYSQTIEILEKGIKRAKIENKEKNSAIKRLRNLSSNKLDA